MSNSLDAIRTAAGTIAHEAETSPMFGPTQTFDRGDNSAMDKIWVPFDIAVRGFSEMAEYSSSFMGLRNITDESSAIVRTIVEVVLNGTYDSTRHPESQKLFIADDEGLFSVEISGSDSKTAGSMYGSWGVGSLGKRLSDIPDLSRRNETFVAKFAAKLTKVAEAAVAASVVN